MHKCMQQKNILMNKQLTLQVVVIAIMILAVSCKPKTATVEEVATTESNDSTQIESRPISEPLVTHIYTADPSAHVFGGKIYIYPSHDIEANVPENDNGDHFDMRDYHVLSMDSINGKTTDNGVALDIKDIPWAGRQLWAPDAAFANGKYYLFFPAKDKSDVFRIGVATSPSPTGPFKAEPKPIDGSYSIDPCVFIDTDGATYMYFGGIWGGQLQRWNTGKYEANGSKTDLGSDTEPELSPKFAKMTKDLLHFDGKVKDIQILNYDDKPLTGGDHDRRFFEASWMHKYNGKYYFSYSTGDTHFIAYAVGENPEGPFTYQGVILNPVVGWTNHHSIVEIDGKWYLFYHDSMLSGGKTHLRSVKVVELTHDADGMINTIEPYIK